MDENRDGLISREEVRKHKHQTCFANLTEDEIAELFDAVDVDKSGSIDYNEFIRACRKRSDFATKKKLEAMFEEFDFDNSNGLSKEEFENMLAEKLTDEDFKKYDADGSGDLDISEYTAMLMDNVHLINKTANRKSVAPSNSGIKFVATSVEEA